MKKHSDILRWASTYLESKGYVMVDTPEIIQETPWSCVARFVTRDGYIYLKHTPEKLSLEARILQALHHEFQAPVPNVIAYNAKLNCFLMEDAGKSLRGILHQKFDEFLLCKAIDQFTSLQISVADRVDVFLNIGVPDWRLNKLPGLYNGLISKRDLLIADGLTEMEISQLEWLLPTVTQLCEKLSTYFINQSMVQPDFNDNNTLIDEKSQHITFIDLGEIAITHPFFSLLNCLQQLKKHYGLREEEGAYQRIKDYCLKNYRNFEPEKQLLEAFSIANLLFPIYGALSGYRLIAACDKARFTGEFQRHGRPSWQLKELITSIDKGITP